MGLRNSLALSSRTQTAIKRGVSATHLDWTMVPYVRISFNKHYRTGARYLGGNTDIHPSTPIGDELYTISSDTYKYALCMTIKEIKQAVEGMYHNLNTLQSRSGNQLPFTSVNYGTCTLPEGRLVTEALLKASIDGVGKLHKTSIFPCGIFTCKKGVNMEDGDPNYDLFKLALKSTSLRLYPNYCNADWSSQVSWLNYDRTVKEEVISSLSDLEIEKLKTIIVNNTDIAEKLMLKVVDDEILVDKTERPWETMSTMGLAS